VLLADNIIPDPFTSIELAQALPVPIAPLQHGPQLTSGGWEPQRHCDHRPKATHTARSLTASCHRRSDSRAVGAADPLLPQLLHGGKRR
jgi:hypothetical protein